MRLHRGWLIALFPLLWLMLLAVMPLGLFLVDEVVQFASIHAWSATGSFVVQNGQPEVQSADLMLLYLVQGPEGAVAQYPAGYTLLAAPFYALAGIRGVYALNTLAAILTLVLSWATAHRLAGPRVALWTLVLLAGCSFLPNYAVAFWPHAVAAFFAIATVYCAVRASQSEQASPIPALLGGAALATGMAMRLDVVLILPPLAAWMVLFARRPYVHLLLAALGMGPVLLFAAWLNLEKFGIFNPFSYGPGRGDGMALGTYVAPLTVAVAAGGMILALRHMRRGRGLLVSLAVFAAAIAILFVAPAQRAFWALAQGFWVLGVDLRDHIQIGTQPGIERAADGDVTFFGLHKKALVQSLPWLALLPLGLRAGPERRSALALGVMVTVFVMLPFAYLSWHGGYANNMRYFLIAVPLACLAGAVALATLAERAPGAGRMIGLSAIATVLGLFALQVLYPARSGAMIEHSLPPLIAAGVLVLSGIAALLNRYPRALWVPAILACTWAGVSAYVMDIRQALAMRAYSASVARAYADHAPGNALIYDNFSQALWPALAAPNQLAAVSATQDGRFDPDVIRWALSTGRPIVIRAPELAVHLPESAGGFVVEAQEIQVTPELSITVFRVAE